MVRKRSRRKPVPEGLHKAQVEKLSSDARGIARIDGKTTFIEGALPGEVVMFRYTRCKSSFDEGITEQVITAAAERVEPRCEYHLVCGGCSMQHLSGEAQVKMKQQILLDNLAQIGKTMPPGILPPIKGEQWGYRRKARLGVRDVKAKGRVLVGFREKSNRYLADIHSCDVLHPSVGQRLDDLSDLIGTLNGRQVIAQIEVAVSDEETALVFRNLQQLDEHDVEKLIAFAQKHVFTVYLQPGNPQTMQLLWPATSRLSYTLTGFGIEIEFQPADFTQVNSSVNTQMVARAIELLELEPSDNVLDLFCGLGNFTLPVSRYVKHVTGVEGDESLLQRARINADINHISNVSFYQADLFKEISDRLFHARRFNKLLLDPPRSGAEYVAHQIKRINPERIVYVSCHTATLARDTEILQRNGYQLLKAGVMDMFPHTMHVESMAVFAKT